MLRVTPLYGSQWNNSGVSRSGCCTLVEYAGIRVLVDVGIRNTTSATSTTTITNDKKNGTMLIGDEVGRRKSGSGGGDGGGNTITISTNESEFWEHLPPHDCLVLTASTLESMGSLPLYVKGIERSAKRRRDARVAEIRLRQRRKSSLLQRNRQRRSSTTNININRDSIISNNKLLTDEETLLLLDDNTANTTTTTTTTTTNDSSTTTQPQSFMDVVPPIFATFPTVKMGQMSLYEHHAQLCLDGGKPSFTMEDMDRAIALIRTIKYSQTISFPIPVGLGLEPAPSPFVCRKINNNNKNNKNDKQQNQNQQQPRLAITAHRAGHVVGCAFYKLVRIKDETSVVITHGYHIARELHLDAATLVTNAVGADVLITQPGGPAAFPILNTLYSNSNSSVSSSSLLTSSKNFNNNNRNNNKPLLLSPLVSKVRGTLTERILGLLRRDANVLLPVDASGRSLEVILLLDLFWSQQNLSQSYNLIWFGSMVHNTLEFSRSQLEWMNSALSKNIFDPSYTNKNNYYNHHTKGSGGGRRNRFSSGNNNSSNNNNNNSNTSGSGGGRGGGNENNSNSVLGHRGGQHPYTLRNVKLCTNMIELEKIIGNSDNNNPTCVVANGLSLDHGPARDLFVKWSDNDNNAIIFTDSSECVSRCRTQAGVRQERERKTAIATAIVAAITEAEAEAEATASTITSATSLGTVDGGGGGGGGGVVIMTATAGAAAAMGARSAVTTAPAATTTATTEVAAAVAAALETTENEDAEAAAVGGDLSQVIDRMRGTPLREEEASQYTASYQLLKSWSLAKIENREMDDSISVDVLIPRRTPLLGQDLQLFLQAEEFACLQQQKREEQAAMLREVELAKTSLRLGNDVDIVDMNDEETNPLLGSVGAGGTAHAVSSSTASEAAAATTGSSSTIMGSNNDGNHKSTSTTSIPVGVSASASAAGTGGGGVGSHLPFFRRPPKKSRFDSSLFLKFSKPLHLTFELREDAVGIGQRDVIAKFGIGASLERNSTNQVIEDDYGIAVRPEQFCDIVTGVDPSKLGPSGRIGDDVQRRGLGFAAGSSTGPGGAGPSSSSGPNNKNNDHRKSSSGGGGNSSSGKMNHKRPYGKYNNDGNTSNSNNAGGGGGGGGGGGFHNNNNNNNNNEDVGIGMKKDNDDDDVDDQNGDVDIDNDERGLEAIDLSEGNGIIRSRNGRPPIKVTTVNRRIEVMAEIDYIPFEGRVDSRSARQSVRALQPRQVVVLGGTRTKNTNMDIGTEEEDIDGIVLIDEVTALADSAQGFVSTSSSTNSQKKEQQQQSAVFTPTDGETVELDVGHAAYPARLIATPFRTKEEKEVEEVRPDPMELLETKIGPCTVSLLDFIATGQKVALDGSIVLAPRGNGNNKATTSKSKSYANTLFSKPPVYVSDGEVLLTDLRTELIVHHGMKAEYSTFAAGYAQLIVNGRVIVKKLSSSGKIEVEGPLCEDFFTVRSVVCSQYVTL